VSSQLDHPAPQELLLNFIHLDRGRIDSTAIRCLDDSDWDALVTLSLTHRVFAQVHTRLNESNLASWAPKTALRRLRRATLNNVVRNLQISQQLQELLAVFEKAGLPVMVLKGAYLAEHVYENAAQRSMSDIDLLILPDRLRAVQALMRDLGYQARLDLSTDNECPFDRPGTPAAVDLHWSLTHPTVDPNISDAPLWERSESVLFGGVPARVLSKEDLLLHLCMHVSYHHKFAVPLRNLLDLAVLSVRVSQKIDWTTVLERAIAWRWDRGTYLCLMLAKNLAGAPIPEAALAGLSRFGASPPVELAKKIVMSGADPSKALRIQALAQGYGLRAAVRTVVKHLRMICRYQFKNGWEGSPAYRVQRVWKTVRRNYKTLRLIMMGDNGLRSEIDEAITIKGFLEGNNGHKARQNG
jgi:Uncharacterised nucleotidyltransferase